jgi:hypothetical protein
MGFVGLGVFFPCPWHGSAFTRRAARQRPRSNEVLAACGNQRRMRVRADRRIGETERTEPIFSSRIKTFRKRHGRSQY